MHHLKCLKPIKKHMNKTIALLSIVLATAATSFAGTAVADSKKVVVPSVQEDLFRANEWQVDAFVAGAAGAYSGTYETYGHRRYNGVGGGLGVSYFFTRYFGVGVDDSLGGLNGNGSTYNTTQGTLIARYPIESWHLAPYALLGGGATWGNHATQGNGSVGGGLEYRFTRSVGIFIDSRYIYGNNTLNETLSRAGFRVIF
jgi:hypothetical protein